jgi:uncharacterized repeat protein (TIGR01451 family)
MNALCSWKCFGVLGTLLICVGLPDRQPAYGSPEGCPFGGCPTAHQAHPVHEAHEPPPDPPSPHVVMKVRVPAHALPGRELEYRVFLENNSPGDAHHVVVKCPLPANVKYVRASPSAHQKEPELQWHLGTMHGGGKCEISLVVVPQGTDDVRMCFRVQYEHGQCVTTRLSELPPRIPGEPPLPSDFDGKGRPPEIKPIPPETPAPKLKLTMEGPKERPVNLPAKYFLTVTNDGKAAATNLLLRAMLPDKTEFVSASDDGVHMAGQIAWLLKELPANQKWTVELAYKSKEPGLRCVKASALADKDVSAQGELCTNFVGLSALYLEMIDREDPIPVGGDTSYPITVVNTGAGPATNLRVRALIPPQMVLDKTTPAEHQLGERIAQGQWIQFAPAAPLEAGGRTEFEVFVKGVQTGDTRFRIEMSADQLERGPVVEVESTYIYDDESKIPVRMLSRKKRTAP